MKTHNLFNESLITDIPPHSHRALKQIYISLVGEINAEFYTSVFFSYSEIYDFIKEHNRLNLEIEQELFPLIFGNDDIK